MTSILVWILIVGGSSHTQQFGPFVDLDSCERVQRSIPYSRGVRCVQVYMPAPK